LAYAFGFVFPALFLIFPFVEFSTKTSLLKGITNLNVALKTKQTKQTNTVYGEIKCVDLLEEMFRDFFLKSLRVEIEKKNICGKSCHLEKQTIIQEAMNFPHYSLCKLFFIFFPLQAHHYSQLKNFLSFRFCTSNASSSFPGDK
jgi:hypothetical protein